MMPHHFKMLLVVLAFPFTYFLGYGLYQGYLDHIHVVTIPEANTARIQHPNYHLVALDALKHFVELPAARQTAIREHLAVRLVDFDVWVREKRRIPAHLICLGENHDNQTRTFLAQHVFPSLPPDHLMIEATAEETIRIQNDTRAYVPLLGADISAILKQLPKTTAVVGIEQNMSQSSLSRERAILANLLGALRADALTMVLYGALHCGDYEGWLYDILTNTNASNLPDQISSVRVLGEHQDGSLEAFIYFLDEIGMKKDNFVITPSRKLDEWLRGAFPVLNDQTLDHFDDVVVFRP